MTCWRRLRAWQHAGLWDEIHRHMLNRLNLAGQIDWSRASADASFVLATGANRHDSMALTAVVEAVNGSLEIDNKPEDTVLESPARQDGEEAGAGAAEARTIAAWREGPGGTRRSEPIFGNPRESEPKAPFRVMRARTDIEMTRNSGADNTAGDEARPSEADLTRYQRSYRMTTDRPERFYWLWQEAMAHALLLEQHGELTYPEHDGLTGLQLAEGARAAARFFAFMLAEAPARETEHLERKIMVYEAIAFDEDEIRRSRTSWMVEAAMQQDARDLDINLTKVPITPGTESRH